MGLAAQELCSSKSRVPGSWQQDLGGQGAAFAACFAAVEHLAFAWSVWEALTIYPCFPGQGTVEGRAKWAGCGVVPASSCAVVDRLTLDKLLNAVCSCFLICKIGVMIVFTP